jgi:hypothetical protein
MQKCAYTYRMGRSEKKEKISLEELIPMAQARWKRFK